MIELVVELAQKQKELKEKYEFSVPWGNSILENCYESYEKIGNFIKKLDIDRSEFMQIILQKIIKLIKNYGKLLGSPNLSEIISLKNSSSYSLNSTRNDIFELIKYEKFDLNQISEITNSHIDKIYEKMLIGQALNSDEIIQISENINNSIENQQKLLKNLSLISEPILYKNEADFTKFVEICLLLLKNEKILNFTSNNSILKDILLKISKFIYFQDQLNPANIKYLYFYIRKNEIFTKLGTWEILIENAISYKLTEISEYRKRNPKSPSVTKDGSEKIKTAISVSEVLYNYVFFLAHFGLNEKLAMQIILKYSNIYDLELLKISELLQEIMQISPIKSLKKAYKLKFSKPISFILQKSLKFISDTTELLSLRLLSKEIKNNIEISIYKKLYLKNSSLTNENRIKLWQKLLRISDSENIDFNSTGNIQIDKSIKNLIQLDIKRSFQDSTIVDPDILTRILENWVFREKDIGYYQGMSFIVGLLILLIKDEKKAFIYFSHIIKNYNMDKNITQNLLLVKFYQLNKLLFNFYPDLAIWLHTQNILSQCFSSAWFITIFSNSIHYINEPKISKLLVEIWDLFLIDGWKAFFKIAIFILGEIRYKICGKPMDEIAKSFNEIQGEFFMNNEILYQKFKSEYKKIKISNKMLRYIEDEYNKIIEKCQQCK